jgi:hypothetical protein
MAVFCEYRKLTSDPMPMLSLKRNLTLNPNRTTLNFYQGINLFKGTWNSDSNVLILSLSLAIALSAALVIFFDLQPFWLCFELLL